MNSNLQNQKPGLVTAIAAMTLTSGIVNLFWGFVASTTALGTIIGAVCLPLTILPTILGVFEIIYAAKLLSAQPQPVQPSPSIAWFQIATMLFGNLFSMVVGILSLIFYNDLTVKDYFNKLNGMVISTPESVSEPLTISEPAPPETNSETEKPKRKAGSKKK